LRLQNRVARERDPEGGERGFRSMKTGGRDAGNGEPAAIEQDGFPGDGWIGMESRMPQIVAEHGDSASRGQAIRCEESATQRDRFIEHVEIIAGGVLAKDRARGFAPQRRRNERRIRQQAIENLVLVAIGFVFSGRQKAGRSVNGAPRVGVEGLIDAGQLLRAGHRKRAQGDAVQHAENTGIDPDSERKGENRDGGKA